MTNKSNDVGVAQPGNELQTGGFVDLDRIEDANGLLAIISQRKSNGVLTFAIFKTFERDGERQRTSFIPKQMADAYRQILDLTVERMQQIEEQGTAPFKAADTRMGQRRAGLRR